MSVWYRLAGCFSDHGKAKALYNRGMKKAKKHDHQGAIEDYTELIRMPGQPPDLTAMVLYNRALVYVASGDDRKGADDLDAVLAMNETLVNVKTMARQQLARMKSRSSQRNV
jgi:hypothetical protein